MNREPTLHSSPKSIMEGYSDDTVWSVQQAILNLLELVDSVAHAEGPEKRENLRAEARRTILMLTADIVIADGICQAGEQAFVRHLVDLSDLPGEDLSYVNEYAALWAAASKVVPRFFSAAVRCDTDIAHSMLREIQFIGNNVCISDREFQAKEREAVAHYVAFLEDSIGGGDLGQACPGIESSASGETEIRSSGIEE